MPDQRILPVATDPPPIGSFVDFGKEDGVDYVVRDIDMGGDARWTRDHPQLKFRLEPKSGLRLVMDFIVVQETFLATGPVTVQVNVNDHPLESIRCTHAGDYRFEKPVPAEWVTSGGPTYVTAEAAPLWIAPSDGVHLGYLLLRAGFRW
jgi:hypothetical protein